MLKEHFCHVCGQKLMRERVTRGNAICYYCRQERRKEAGKKRYQQDKILSTRIVEKKKI